MTKWPFLKFFVKDWLGDTALRSVSVAARGLWIDMLCFMHTSDRRGFLQHASGEPMTADHISRLTGVAADEVSRLLQELENSGALVRTNTGTIYNKRMVKDESKRRKCRVAGRLGGNPTLKGQSKGGVNPPLDSDTEVNEQPETKKQQLQLPENLKHQSFKDAWLRWVEYKRESKKKLKFSTAQGQLKKLSSYGLAKAIQSIDESIANGWVGLFEPKTNGAFRSQPSIFKPASDEVREHIEQRVQAELGPGEKPREIPRYVVPE